MFQLAYHLLWLVALLLLSPIYLYRVLAQGKYKQSTFARLGFQSLPKLNHKQVIWMHSVSLGESQISDQFAQALKQRFPESYIVASSCTETGQEVLINSQAIDFSFYYPFDFLFLVKRIFNRLKPKAIIVMETDLWPNMLAEADKRSIPVSLMNAKISESTFNNYQRMPFIASRLLDPVEHFYVQCNAYDQRFEKLGVEKQRRLVSGNLKLDRSYSSKTDQELTTLSQTLGLNLQRPILVFASSHPGEEQGFISIYQDLKRSLSDLQVVFVPRHPERFKEVEGLLSGAGLDFNKSSERPLQAKDCLLLDEMGVLMDIYALCSVAVVAGSFTDKVGGHNIFEPGFYAKPAVYGPWIFKQPGFHDLIQEKGGAIQIIEQEWQQSLKNELESLLQNQEQRAKLGEQAKSVIDDSQGMAEKLIDDLVQAYPNIFK